MLCLTCIVHLEVGLAELSNSSRREGSGGWEESDALRWET